MTRLFVSLALFLFALISPFTTNAQNKVSIQDAQKVSNTLLHALGHDTKSLLTPIECPINELIVFSMGEKGFVILSADKNSEPILGYSTENPICLTDMPANLRLWLEGYAATVRYNSCHPELTSSKQAREKWQRLEAGDENALRVNGPKASIPTMLKTTWNQSPRYNKFCPFDTAEGKLAVTGCTATATAQIMKYFNHPAEGYGHGEYTHKRYGVIACDYGTYNWDSMPNALSGSSSEEEIDAVATLIYHCGVAVHMDYSPNGSGGKTAAYGYGGDAASENAFKYNFKYSPYVWTAFRCDYNDKDWKDLMFNELQNGRPILYAGYDEVQAGHAFVIDGYKSMDGTFHVNWGWGSSADGFFLITNLNPGGYNFNLFATATIGITPFDGFGQATTVVNTSVEGIHGASATDGTVTGSGSYNFGDTIVMTATATNAHTRFVQWSDGCRYNPRSTVATGGEVNFTAIFEPLTVDTIRYYTTGNAMNRAANIPEHLATDSVWGIKIDASAIKAGSTLQAIRLQGRKAATHDLTIYSGIDSPDEVIYEDSFFDSLDYDFTFHTHLLSNPLPLDGTKSLWIKLKCTEVDTPGVFSIWGGNSNGMLVGDDLHPRDDWKFSWMIEALFSNNVGIESSQLSTDNCQVSIFPNPATNNVTINIGSSSSMANEVSIIDITGRPVYNTTLNGTSSLQVDISNLTPGIYFVLLNNESGITVKKLSVK